MPVASVRRRVEAATRRAMRQAIRVGVPVVALGILADGIHLLIRYGTDAQPAAALGVLAIGLTGVVARLGTRDSHRPEPPALAILLILYAVTLLNARLLTADAPIAAGYQSLILVGSALFLPWPPRWHAAWLAHHQADYAAGRSLAEESVQIFRQMSDPRGVGRALVVQALESSTHADDVIIGMG